MKELDERTAEEIDAIVDNCDKGRACEMPAHVHWSDIPVLGTIDSYTGDIAWLELPEMDPNETYTDGPLPEPTAPPLTAENYADGRMSFGAWLVGALGLAVAIAIAAVMVLVERVRKGGKES